MVRPTTGKAGGYVMFPHTAARSGNIATPKKREPQPVTPTGNVTAKLAAWYSVIIGFPRSHRNGVIDT